MYEHTLKIKSSKDRKTAMISLFVLNSYFGPICHLIAYVAGDSNKTELSGNGSNFFKPEQDKIQKATGGHKETHPSTHTLPSTPTHHAPGHWAGRDFKMQIRYPRSNKSL